MNFEQLSIRKTERKEDRVWSLQRERERERESVFSTMWRLWDRACKEFARV